MSSSSRRLSPLNDLSRGNPQNQHVFKLLLILALDVNSQGLQFRERLQHTKKCWDVSDRILQCDGLEVGHCDDVGGQPGEAVSSDIQLAAVDKDGRWE